MGCRVLSDDSRAVLYCSTSEVAFGPVFESAGHAELFLAWMYEEYEDPRRYNQANLQYHYETFLEKLKTGAFSGKLKENFDYLFEED